MGGAISKESRRTRTQSLAILWGDMKVRWDTCSGFFVTKRKSTKKSKAKKTKSEQARDWTNLFDSLPEKTRRNAASRSSMESKTNTFYSMGPNTQSSTTTADTSPKAEPTDSPVSEEDGQLLDLEPVISPQVLLPPVTFVRKNSSRFHEHLNSPVTTTFLLHSPTKPEFRPLHARSKSDSLLYSKPVTTKPSATLETSPKTQMYGDVPILILTKAEIPRRRRLRNKFSQRELKAQQTQSMVLMTETPQTKIVCGLPCESSRRERELESTLRKLTGGPVQQS